MSQKFGRTSYGRDFRKGAESTLTHFGQNSQDTASRNIEIQGHHRASSTLDHYATKLHDVCSVTNYSKKSLVNSSRASPQKESLVDILNKCGERRDELEISARMQ